MFEGIKEKGKIDPEFEYGWYMESIDLHCDGVENRAKEVLWGMFRGVLRFVTGYRWLEECPMGIDLTGINVTAVAQQNEAGKTITIFWGTGTLYLPLHPARTAAQG